MSGGGSRRSPAAATIRIGLSACLLGQAVRYDGGHKRDRFLADVLGPHVEWVPVCPEVEMGLSVPRPTLRLVGDPRSPRLEMPSTGEDHTASMKAFAKARLDALEALDLHGYVLKSKSPSCGMQEVPVHGKKGPSIHRGVGLFARALIDRFPDLPVEEEGRLGDPRLRDHWLERVFARARWREVVALGLTVARLVAFHTAHELVLMAHDPVRCRKLGRLAAGATGTSRRALEQQYGRLFARTLAVPATANSHAKVLQHLQGFAKTAMNADDRAETAQAIDDYRRGLVPLLVPVTLLRQHLRRAGSERAIGEVYLERRPPELTLRPYV